MKKTNITSKEACTLAHKIRRETGCSLAEAFKMAYNGQTQVETKTHWTAEELNKIFSDKASELIRKGYMIDVAGLAGHQGEIGKIVFRKDGCWYALVMESNSTFGEGKYDDKYTIWFGKYTEDTTGMCYLNTWNTPWLNKFEASWSLEFIKLTNNYFVTPEVAKAANQKWRERCRNRSYRVEEVSSKYNKAILACVRKEKGYKSVKASEIIKVTRITTYNSFEDKYNKRYYTVTLSRTNKYGKNITVDIKF